VLFLLSCRVMPIKAIPWMSPLKMKKVVSTP
ncbi:hypothetical protein AZZ84_002925, partial [Escherichia coli]